MKKYVCAICGYVYDEAENAKSWATLSDDWKCPICAASKDEFRPDMVSVDTDRKLVKTYDIDSTDMHQMNSLEISALCSNLARGCDKQYKPEEAALFLELAAFFKAGAIPAEDADFAKILELVESDLENEIPNANSIAKANGDRGALRALTWSEKVTRILRSLLIRHAKEGESMLVNTGVYVCTICGFIFVGDVLPEVCPVCKVPNWKFEMIEGR